MNKSLPLIALIAVLSLPVSGGFAPRQADVPEVLRAQKFELVDKSGRVRIELRIEDDQPVAALKDEEGRDRVVIFHQPDATGVYIRDAKETTRIGLAQFPHGGGIAMHGAESKGAAVYVLMNDQPRLTTYNSEGKVTNNWPPKANPATDSSDKKDE